MKLSKRKRYCNIRATSLEQILERCDRHILNIGKTQWDLVDNQDGTDKDLFYIEMFRGTWMDLRDDVAALLERQKQ